MRLLRSFPLMAFLLVMLSIIAFCAAQESVALLLVAGTLAALSWYVTEGPRGRTLPKWVSNVLVVAVALSVIVDFWQNREDVLGVLGRLSIWLTLIKLYERRAARDHAHLLGLSLLLMLVGCLQTKSLLFGVLLLVYAVLGLYVLLLYQLYAAYEQVSAARRASFPEQRLPAPRLRPTIGRHLTVQFRALAAGIGVTGIFFSAVLFLIFPRNIGRDMFTRPYRDAAVTRTGYSDEVNLIGGTRITESQSAAFDLQITDETGRPVRLDEPLLLRGAALDFYHLGQWSASTVSTDRIETIPGRWTALGDTVAGAEPALRQRFRFRHGTARVFSAYVPSAVFTEERRALSYDPITQTLRTPSGSAVLDSYVIESRLAPRDDLVAALSYRRPPSPSVAGRYRDSTDPASPKVGDLARQLLSRAGLDPRPTRGGERWRWNAAAASVFVDYLRSDAFTYTLDMSEMGRGGVDPIAEFLFASRRGHCEFFASALAALCHTSDIDARVVTGYVVHPPETADEWITVSESAAHAWVEVRTGMFRYTPYDATPPSALAPVDDSGGALTARLGEMFSYVQRVWQDGVIGFDDRAQSRLFESLDAGFTQRVAVFLEATRQWMERVNRAFSMWQMGYIWLGIVAFAIILAVLSAIKVTRRVRQLRRTMHLKQLHDAESRRLLRQLGFYLDMLTVLAKGGCGKPAWQPPLAYASTLGEARPPVADLVTQITDVYYRARYGRRRLTVEEMADARHLVQELARTLKVKL